MRIDLSTMFAGDGTYTTELQAPVLTRAGQCVVCKGKSLTYEFLGTTAQCKRMNPTEATIHARTIEGPEDFSATTVKNSSMCCLAL